MEIDPKDMLAEEALVRVGDKVFGSDVKSQDFFGSLFEDSPFHADVAMTCVGLLAGGPVFLLMKAALWAKDMSER